jgi:hypothetical protein
MRVHHRIPSIFNLSMVDVLCCSLGCVILLWLINLREAKNHEETAAQQVRDTRTQLDEATARAASTSSQLARVTQERDLLTRQLASLTARADALETEKTDLQRSLTVRSEALQRLEMQAKESAERMAALQREMDASNKAMTQHKSRAEELAALLSDQTKAATRSRERTEELAAQLAEQTKAMTRNKEKADDLTGRMADQARDMQAQAALIVTLRSDLKSAQEKAADAKRRLEELQATRAALQRDLDQRGKDLVAALPYKDRLARAEERILSLEKDLGRRLQDLTAAASNIEALQGEKKGLQAEAARIKTEADNRFAGITLSGRRVIFLVDMSGSMRMVDSKTQSPGKWEEVGQTVVKLMKSMPTLKQYQVIVFSDKALFLTGTPYQWLEYDGRSTPEKVLKALTSLEPQGGTNMYTALQMCFMMRPLGLDTIYLLSDGLPNQGEGATAEEVRKLSEPELSAKLGQHIRKTLRADWNREIRDQGRVRINTIGFFYESPEVGAFLWALARDNDGNFVGMSKP